MRIVAITQARMGSTRLPGKILKKIGHDTLLDLHIQRILKSQAITSLIVATTTDPEDDAIVDIAAKYNVHCYRGSVNDVLDRFYKCLEGQPAQYIVRLTSDCPLIDPMLIDKVVTHAVKKNVDYCSNTLEPTYPDGQDIEVFKLSSLVKAWQDATLSSEREHVTPYIWKNSTYSGGQLFTSDNYSEGKSFGHLRMTVDEPDDFHLIQKLVTNLGKDRSWLEYAEYLETNQSVRKINDRITRNEGYKSSLNKEQMTMSKRYKQSEDYLQRALRTIPLGSQTFSKSKTQLPLGVSPFFASKGKGGHLWDVDGNKYIDFANSLCSITLGYNDPDINKAVRAQLKKGTIFSLAHELEFKVAEKIVAMVPCAEMVRFGKNGSDATSGAIRLARAYTKRDHVLVCGYHGWQDWYIGSTTRDLGVPESVKALTHKFNYNDVESLATKLQSLKGQVAAVILEPVNVIPPQDNFLQRVKEMTHEHGAVLIFDETITGFRFAKGGAQEFFGVTPDLACFGKGLANGYPLSAVAGRASIMQLMEEIFFSFTFGGETLSLAAADAVLTKLKEKPVIEKLFKTGETLKSMLSALISKSGLEAIFTISGYPVWSFLIIKDTPLYNASELKTLLLQEMFSNGIYMLGTHNISYAHSEADVRRLMDVYRLYFEKVRIAIGTGDLKSLLRCEPLKPLFKVR